MADQEKRFGTFGSGKPVVRKRRPWMSLLFYGAVLLGLVVFVPPLLKSGEALYRSVVERESPTVEFVSVPNGIGRAAVELEIKVVDAHSGLDQVVVQIEQSRTVLELMRKNYSRAQREDILRVQIDPEQLSLREGELAVAVKVFDKSLWSNSVKKTSTFTVDFVPPSIEVLSTQHNAVEGGVELVFYRLVSDPNVFSGVVVDSTLFPGFPAIALDEAFAATPDVYFAFFALPGDAASRRPSLRLIARDAVGNTTSTDVPFRALDREQQTISVKMQRDDLLKMVDQTFESYLRFAAAIEGREPNEFYPTISDAELKERFSVLVDEYAKAVENEAAQLFARPKRTRFWRGPFGRPLGRPFAARFFWTIDWLYEGEVLGSHKSLELWLASAPGREVGAANHGKVIFADTLGPYGMSVILDHGLGLTTLYTHLSSVACREGDELRKGQTVGLTGMSGLIPFSGSGYQLRLHGVPIRPEEWWDRSWLKNHFDAKISQAIRELGIQVPRPLESLGDELL